MRGSRVWFCSTVCFFLICSASAFAKEVHIYKSSFGHEGAGPGQFRKPLGIAVDDGSHDVYVVDGGNHRVEKFDSTGASLLCEYGGSSEGELVEPTEIAVDNSNSPLDSSAGDVYVVDRGRGAVYKFDPTCGDVAHIAGTPEGLFEPGEATDRGLKGVAVDPQGTLWISIKHGPIYRFDDSLTNKYQSMVQDVFGSVTDGLGVDAINGEDILYLGNIPTGFGRESGSGELVPQSPFAGDANAFGIAVDGSRHKVYLDSRQDISVFASHDDQEHKDEELLETFGSGLLTVSSGVAVDEGDGTVFVSDQALDEVAVFESVLLPSVSTLGLTEQRPREVTLNGMVNPESRLVTSCVFEYATTEEYSLTKGYGHSVGCSPSSVGSGASPVRVSARLAGLLPGASYDYRLVAQNSANVPSATPDVQFFTGPLVRNTFAAEVTADSARLNVSIDPNGGDTQYYLEYGPTVGYGSFAPLEPPGVDLGSSVSQEVTVRLEGLTTGVSYHYRFVAIQDGEAFDGGDRSFVTQGNGVLPGDARTWELVSPSDKKGAFVGLFELGGQVQAANDGSGITYVVQGPHVGEDQAGQSTYLQILSRRSSGGWRSTDMALPGIVPESNEPPAKMWHFQFEYRLFSPSLSSAAVEPQEAGTPLLSPEATDRTLYLRDNASGIFLPLVAPQNVPPGTRIEERGNELAFEMHFLAATPDLSHVVFKTPMALTPEATDEENLANRDPSRVQWNLYDWSAEKLQLVNILPNGVVAHGRYSVSPPVRLAGMRDSTGVGRGTAQRSISDDGRWVAWTWGEPYTVEDRPKYRGLYARDMLEEKTVRVGGPGAVYQTMNSDGSRIFFLENGDLFEFDTATGKAVDLTPHAIAEADAGVQEAVSDVSRDGSFVYFVATGALAHGAVAGEYNLYVARDTEGTRTVSYIATLSSQDRPDWYAAITDAPFLARMGSRVSPNGRYLAFMSERSLTGYDNIDAVSGQPDEEVYLYDSLTGRLICASCNPTGSRPTGVLDAPSSELLIDRQAVWTSAESRATDPHTDHWLAGSVPGWDNLNQNPATYQPRYLSDDGRLFFNSPDGLSAQDTNGVEDVYEFEPAGVGACRLEDPEFSETTGGCVSAMSSGTSGEESAFFDASESGDDVFFATTSKLVSEDYDKGYDVYDAHVCSAQSPCMAPGGQPLPPCASSDSCKAVPSPQPTIFGPPPTATFTGSGNVSPSHDSVRKAKTTSKLARALRACRKQKGRRHSRCERRARRLYGSILPNKHARAQRQRRAGR